MTTSRWMVPEVMVVVALVAAGCGAPHGPRAVRIECDEALTQLSPLSGWISARVDGEPQGLLLSDGDVLTGDSTLFQYRSSDGPVLRLASNEWSTSLSGKVVSVSLDSAAAWRWLEGASERDLDGLRIVAVSASLDGSHLPALKRLAAVNPNVGLVIGSSASLAGVLPHFHPRWLYLSDCTPDAYTAASSMRNVETLMISASDSGSLDILPRLPRLHRLAILDWDLEAAGALPAGINGLRSLAVWSAEGMTDLSALRALPTGLEELLLCWMDEPLDLTGLAEFPALRKLVLSGSETSSDVSRLAGINKLQWLGIPKNITREQFAALITMHPGLKTLEINAPGSVIDLAPLRSLTRLEGLLLSGEFEHLEALNGLKSLRFVGLRVESDSQRVALRKALPDALVVPLESISLCLGSGWMLLVVPVAAGFWFFGPRSRKRRPGGARAA